MSLLQWSTPKLLFLDLLLFLIYVNDIGDAVPDISTLLFANDTNIFLSYATIVTT